MPMVLMLRVKHDTTLVAATRLIVVSRIAPIEAVCGLQDLLHLQE